MTINFLDIPNDPDTRIIRQKQVMIENIPALIQKWAWEGIVAESAIFLDEDVDGITDEELFNKIIDNYDVGPDRRHTVTRNSGGYTFVNFNFTYL